MDKVFITKSELTKLINTQKNKSGPFLAAICLFWFLSSLLVFILPMIMFGIFLLIIYIPFYFVDQIIIERKNNDKL